MSNVQNDLELYDVLREATIDELICITKIINESFSGNLPDNCIDPQKIITELQLIGGNTFVNLFRGHGVPYKELAFDAAQKVGAKVNSTDSIKEIEWALLKTLFENVMKIMPLEEKQKVFESINNEKIENKLDSEEELYEDFVRNFPNNPTKYMDFILPSLLKTLGLTGAATFLATRLGASAIPFFGWSFALGTMIHSVAGPAYSVTIPCTAIIGAIRVRSEAIRNSEELKK